MALTQKLHAMIEGAKEDWNNREEAKRKREAEQLERGLAVLKQALILGLGDELWVELEASGATIQTDPIKLNASLLLNINGFALNVVLVPHQGPEGKVKTLVSLYESNSCILNGKAHYFGLEEKEKGCLREAVLLAFSQIQA